MLHAWLGLQTLDCGCDKDSSDPKFWFTLQSLFCEYDQWTPTTLQRGPLETF